MSKAVAIKTAVRIAASWSAYSVTSQVIRNNFVAMTTIQKIEVAVASVVLGSLVGDAAEEHAAELFDNLAQAWDKAKFRTAQK